MMAGGSRVAADDVISHARPSGSCGCLRRRASIQLPAAAADSDTSKSVSPRQLQHCSRRRPCGTSEPCPSPHSAGTLTPPPTPRRGTSLDVPLPSRQRHWGSDSCSSCSSSSPQLSAALPAAPQLAAAQALPPAAAAAALQLEAAAMAEAQARPPRQQRKRQQRKRHRGVALLVLQLCCGLWLSACALALCLWLAATL